MLYKEGGSRPKCFDALAHALINRQQLVGWSDFSGESSFCGQANQVKRFQGGYQHKRYQDCRDPKCLVASYPKVGTRQLEQGAIDAAERACRQVLSGIDPTGGAQYWLSPGYKQAWWDQQIKKGNCKRVPPIPGCDMQFLICTNPPR